MADTLPRAEIVHAIDGRARLRIASRRGDAAFFAALASGLSAMPGIYHVEVRPLTGSVLLQHGPPLARIGAVAAERRLFVLADAGAAPSPTPTIALDPKIVAAAGVGLVALWQLAQGRVLPPAATLAWYTAHLAGLFQGDASDGAAE